MKYLTQLLIMALSVVLLACGSNSGNSDKTDQETPQQTEAKKSKQTLNVKKKMKGINVEIPGDIVWKDAYNINNAELDARRKKLLINYNNLYLTINNKNESEAILITLNDLIKVAKETFRAEEERMERFKYDNYQQHKKEHEEFLSKLAKLKDSLSNNPKSNDINDEDIIHLKQFLSNHFSKTDVEMGKFLIEAGSY